MPKENWEICAEWLREKYSNADPKLWICISGFRDKEKVNYGNQIRNLEYAIEAAFNYNDNKWNVYYGIGLGAERPPEYKRYSTEHVVYYPFTYLDIDCGKPKKPDTQEMALRAFQNMPAIIQPAWINSSGNGIHIYYPVKNPMIHNESERKNMQALSVRLQGRIKGYLSNEYSWGFDKVSDLARIDRLPLSVNWKDPNGKMGGIIK